MKTQLRTIKGILKEQIAGGIYTSQRKLPSERELSELFKTTRITLKEALIALETEGLIYREERRGWFVSPPRLRYNPLSRSHFHRMVEEQQRQASTQVLTVKTELASSEISKVLQLKTLQPIHRIQRLRSVDNRVVLFVENCLISALFPDLLHHDLSQSLTALYKKHYGFETARSRFDVIPTAAPEQVAKALNLAEGQQVLKICRVNYNQQGVVMDCEYEYWRPDAMMIEIESISPHSNACEP
ncbi:UTRA domain-containing protein [Oceanospirillum linum]|uniref:MFS transporter n=1 Tax=Oceanospirillum linum TaxID=966 RepID=A0A1T1HCL2_OCELI|nr:UTRA domain-containing protein [Oceanospirillum linum]OOV87457.1 MFS transporter [Oceanospirillum linum]SEF88464.1 DNA-binding transcriptional regulator, GntR family [Oleiphilus messinensis]SMP13743.1 transcriptional regulator, GntR family [Oceanospirillum linum]